MMRRLRKRSGARPVEALGGDACGSAVARRLLKRSGEMPGGGGYDA